MGDSIEPRDDEGPDQQPRPRADGAGEAGATGEQVAHPADPDPSAGGAAGGGPTSGGAAGTGRTGDGPHRPTSPGGLNSVGMNSGSGHARSNLPGARSRTTGDAGYTFCDWITCDVAFCDCNTLLRLSVVLRLAAALTPPVGSGRAVLSVLGFYRRHLTRFTPVCPSTPSCSAYAEAVVRELGPRRGLGAAADRIRTCGRSARPDR
jgi:hypothetical protein